MFLLRTRSVGKKLIRLAQIKDLQAAKAKATYKSVAEVDNQIKCVFRRRDNIGYAS